MRRRRCGAGPRRPTKPRRSSSSSPARAARPARRPTSCFAEYAKRDDVLALSFNVDYWDYLGWKDTLASPDNTERQRDYAAARGDGQVYTPQVGDRRPRARRRQRPRGDRRGDDPGRCRRACSVPITLSPGDRRDHRQDRRRAAAECRTPRCGWSCTTARSACRSSAARTRGKTITYSNVVRKLRPIAMWKGEPMSVDLPRSEMTQAKVVRCAVLLQTETADGLPGPILGAATIVLPGRSLGPFEARRVAAILPATYALRAPRLRRATSSCM